MKILLVDDDAFLRDMYATKFTESGDVVVTAQSGSEALRALENEGPFEVVLLDLVMPGLTGLQIMKEIRSREEWANVKCIVLSNQGEEADINDATAAGALGYIIKAESIPSEVVERVHELVNG